MMEITKDKPYMEPKMPVYAVHLSSNPSLIDNQHIPHGTPCRVFANIEQARQYIRDVQAEAMHTHENCFATTQMQKAGLYMCNWCS